MEILHIDLLLGVNNDITGCKIRDFSSALLLSRLINFGHWRNPPMLISELVTEIMVRKILSGLVNLSLILPGSGLFLFLH